MLVECSSPECSLQFPDDIATCPVCGQPAGNQVASSPVTIEEDDGPVIYTTGPLDSITAASLPIARSCPQCGSTQSFESETTALFTVRRPRRCQSCNTVYYYPVSRTLAAALMVIGALLSVGTSIACIDLARSNNLAAVVTNAPIIAVGFVTISMGIRYWRNGLTASDADSERNRTESA